ncbi:hypothetical protein ACFLQM_03280 [Acidobacteriota bacterium]
MREKIGGFRVFDALGSEKDSSVKDFVSLVQQFTPSAVVGYPSPICRVVGELLPGQVEIGTTVTTGEGLTALQRTLLRERLGSEVFEYYGSNEINSIAFECEHHKLHVVDEHVILETVDEAGQPVIGEPGRVLVTDLDNLAMPFIRYEIGDVATIDPNPCPCGRSLTVLSALDGRLQDRLTSPSGRELPAIFFSSLFRNLRSLTKYQLEQTSPTRVEVRYVREGAAAAEEAGRIASEVRSQFGSEVAVDLTEVPEIPLTPRGKSRLVIGSETGGIRPAQSGDDT